MEAVDTRMCGVEEASRTHMMHEDRIPLITYGRAPASPGLDLSSAGRVAGESTSPDRRRSRDGKDTLALRFLLEGRDRGEPCLYVTLSETEDELRAVARSMTGRWMACRSTSSADRPSIFKGNTPSSIRPRSSSARRQGGARGGRTRKSDAGGLRLVVRDASARARAAAISASDPEAEATLRRAILHRAAAGRSHGGRQRLQLQSLAPRRDLRSSSWRRNTAPSGDGSASSNCAACKSGRLPRLHDSTGGLAVYPAARRERAGSRTDEADRSGSPGRTSCWAAGSSAERRRSSSVPPVPASRRSPTRSRVRRRAPAPACDLSVRRRARRPFWIAAPRPRGRTHRAASRRANVTGRRSIRRRCRRANSRIGCRSRVDDGCRVVMIDSLNGYMNAMPRRSALLAHARAVHVSLRQRGVATISVVAQHGIIGVDGLIAGSELSRRQRHAAALLRGQRLRPQGDLGDEEAHRPAREDDSRIRCRTGANPRRRALREFQGVLTGVPQYIGNSEPLLRHRTQSTLTVRRTVLIFAPIGRDGPLTRELLERPRSTR